MARGTSLIHVEIYIAFLMKKIFQVQQWEKWVTNLHSKEKGRN